MLSFTRHLRLISDRCVIEKTACILAHHLCWSWNKGALLIEIGHDSLFRLRVQFEDGNRIFWVSMRDLVGLKKICWRGIVSHPLAFLLPI